jgi:hypothetical protein
VSMPMGTEFRAELTSNFKPHVGQFVIWGLLLHEMVLMRVNLPRWEGLRNTPATVFSFLPVEILISPLVFHFFRWLFVVAGILWILQLRLPISSWVCVFAYTITSAMVFENSTQIEHTKNLANIVLFVQAMWYHFHAGDIRTAVARNSLWISRIYPGWTYCLSLFCIAIYHSNAALAKVLESGLRWPNGLSLQLWIDLMGREHSLANPLILADRGTAALMQWVVLVVEASAILGVFFTRLRVPIGVALLGLYIGIAESFGYSFLLNAFLVAAFFFPWSGIMDRSGIMDQACDVAKRRFKVSITVARGSRLERILGFVLPRLDVFRMIKLSSQ